MTSCNAVEQSCLEALLPIQIQFTGKWLPACWACLSVCLASCLPFYQAFKTMLLICLEPHTVLLLAVSCLTTCHTQPYLTYVSSRLTSRTHNTSTLSLHSQIIHGAVVVRCSCCFYFLIFQFGIIDLFCGAIFNLSAEFQRVAEEFGSLRFLTYYLNLILIAII